MSESVNNQDERYAFRWRGKSRARQLAQTPATSTLRACPEASVNASTTKNVFIEDDNLEVLKVLQKSYYRKLKMIYIDPPYNTGKGFIYPDKWQGSWDEYQRYGSHVDKGEQQGSDNRESCGRYHTNSLNMMYPRLLLARERLRDEGAIFISIDDHEVHNLRQMLDEVFGPENFLTQFSWRTDGNFDNQAKFKKCHEYIVVYGRCAEAFPMPPVVDPTLPASSKIYRTEIRNTVIKNGPKNPVGEVTLPSGFAEGPLLTGTSSWPRYHGKALFAGNKLLFSIKVTSGWSSKDLLLKFIANNCQPIEDSKGQSMRFVITKTGTIDGIKQRTESPSHVLTLLRGLGGPQ